MFKTNQENIKNNDRNTLFASITNQNFPQLAPKNKNEDQYQSSFLKSSNYSKTPYQERQSFRHDNSQFHQQDSQHSASSDSTFSFHEYKDILNNLFESSQHEQEWKMVPEIVKLIIKAMSLSINAVEKKVTQNRAIINEHGLQIKENQLSLENFTITLKKINEKNIISKSQSSISVRNQEQKKRSFIREKLQKQGNQFATHGLDAIMIEEVKTITDAIFSKRIFQINNQIEELEEKMEENLQKQYEKLQGEVQALKTWIPQLQIKQKIQQEKFQQSMKQHLTLINKQSTHLIKQLQDEKEAMCQLGHYIEDNFCKRQQVNEVLKSNYDTKGSKVTQNYESLNLSRNKIEEIVKNEMQTFQIVRRKEFDEFKQKIMKSINNFATVTQVEKIVNKENKVCIGKKIEEIQELHFNEKSLKDQDTLELRKPKKRNLKDQLKFKQKSPISKKDKSTTKISKKKSEKELHSSKVSKNGSKSRKISQFSHQQSMNDSPLIIEEKSVKTKQTPHDRSEYKLSRSQMQQEIESTLMRKFELRIKEIKQSNKESISGQIESEVNKLQKRLTKRLQTAEEEFCAVVQQNWRTMSQNNLRIQKSQKQGIQNLLKVVSVLNVIARYSTIVNCPTNDSLKWEKEVFNSTGKGVVMLSTDKSLIYFGVAGVYEIHIVVYTLYDPVVAFSVEINGEEVVRKSQRLGVKIEGNDGQKGEESMNQLKKINKKQQSLMPTISHPSSGVQFRSALLIPAKSNLKIKMLNELNGQALMQIRKM